MPSSIPALPLVFACLSLLFGSTAAWAATPDLFGRAHISKAYDTHEAVKRARAKGLSSSVWEALDDPQSAMALRAAIVDALVLGGHGPSSLKRYTLKLVYAKKRNLSDLHTREVFTLGWMRARVRPHAFGPSEGAHEIQRADPVIMLNAAANRMRGELSINMIHALLKSQRALNAPKQMLCAPHVCVDDVLKNHQTHWSMHPDAMCRIVDAVSLPKRPKPKIGARLCKMIRAKHARAPVHQSSEEAPTKAIAHKRSTTQATPSPTLLLPGMGKLPMVNLQQLAKSGQLPPAYVKMMRMMHSQALQNIRGINSGAQQGTRPGPVNHKALKDSLRSIPLDTGDTKRAPQIGRVIELSPPPEDEE